MMKPATTRTGGRFLRLFRGTNKRMPPRSSSNETAETACSSAEQDDLQDDTAPDADESETTLSYNDFAPQGPLKIPTQKASLCVRYGQHSTTSRAATSHKKKCVGFSETTVHYHSLVLGDNPSVTTGGVPLALGQERPDLRQSMPVDAFLASQENRPDTNWGGKEPLVIPASARTQMLVQEGIDETEIQKYSQYLKLRQQNPHLAARLYPQYNGHASV